MYDSSLMWITFGPAISGRDAARSGLDHRESGATSDLGTWLSSDPTSPGDRHVCC